MKQEKIYLVYEVCGHSELLYVGSDLDNTIRAISKEWMLSHEQEEVLKINLELRFEDGTKIVIDKAKLDCFVGSVR